MRIKRVAALTVTAIVAVGPLAPGAAADHGCPDATFKVSPAEGRPAAAFGVDGRNFWQACGDSNVGERGLTITFEQGDKVWEIGVVNGPHFTGPLYVPDGDAQHERFRGAKAAAPVPGPATIRVNGSHVNRAVAFQVLAPSSGGAEVKGESAEVRRVRHVHRVRHRHRDGRVHIHRRVHMHRVVVRNAQPAPAAQAAPPAPESPSEALAHALRVSRGLVRAWKGNDRAEAHRIATTEVVRYLFDEWGRHKSGLKWDEATCRQASSSSPAAFDCTARVTGETLQMQVRRQADGGWIVQAAVLVSRG